MRRWFVVVGIVLVAGAAGLWAICRGAPRSIAPGPIAAKPRPSSRLATDPVEPPPAGALRLEGQVIDEQDRPVAAARVVLLRRGVATASAADGSFVFEHLGAARYTLAATQGEDTYSSSPEIELTEESEPVVIRLRAASILTVHVVDAESHGPIAGAVVRYRACPPLWACGPGAVEPTTDAQGVVQLHGIYPEGVVALAVSAEGHATVDVERELGSEVATHEELRIELARGVPVGGTVVGPSGEPVAGATVLVTGAQVFLRLTADAHGAWRAPGLGAGTHRFGAHADGFRSAATLELELDGVRPRDDIAIPVVALPRVTGMVVDAARRPVAGASIAAGRWSSARSGADGRFTVWLDLGDTTAVVTAMEGPRISEAVTVTLDAAHVPDVRLTLVSSTIAGVVVDPRGKPVPRAVIRVDGGEEHYRTDDRADGSGHFELEGIAAGAHRLAAQRSEQVWAQTVHWVSAATGDRDVKLVAPDVEQLTGRVVLDGRPVTRFNVEVLEADDDQTGLTDEPVLARDGRFTKRGLRPGTWRLILHGPGFARQEIAGIAIANGGEKDLGDIAVDHGAVLRGRVTDTRGAPVVGATVTFHAGPRYDLARMSDDVRVLTDAAGAYRLDGIAPPIAGAHLVARHATLGTSAERIVGERDAAIDLVIAPGGGIDGKLVGGNEYFVRAISPRDPSLDVEAQLDNVGGFHFENLVPGEYVLGLPYSPVRPVRVTVVAGQHATAVLVMPKTTVQLAVRAGACTSLRLETAVTHDAVYTQTCDEPVFHMVGPGDYWICADETCRPVTVTPEPGEQSFTVR